MIDFWGEICDNECSEIQWLATGLRNIRRFVVPFVGQHGASYTGFDTKPCPLGTTKRKRRSETVASLLMDRVLCFSVQEIPQMAGNRKSLGKGLRFDVFKRDGFTCQYCGCKPPDVVLQVDHIMPVAAGGNNDISNLVTACEACNQGKKAKRLELSPRPDADLAWLEMQQELAELRRYQDAKSERDGIMAEVVDNLQAMWLDFTGLNWHPAEHLLRQMISAYSPETVEQAIVIIAPKLSSGYVTKTGWLKYMHGTLRNLAEQAME